MRTISTSPQPAKVRGPAAKPFTTRSDASIRDTVRVLSEVVTQLAERIELLEARELLRRPA